MSTKRAINSMLLLVLIIFTVSAKADASGIGGGHYGRPVIKTHEGFDPNGGKYAAPSQEEREQHMEEWKKIGRGMKETGKRWFGNGGGEKVLQRVIDKHAAFCRKMGIIFEESNSPMNKTEVAIPHIWVYYYINAKDVEQDDLCRIYIAAYEELERLVNEDEELRPYLEEERYTRVGDRLILGFNCVDENFVKQAMPNLGYISKNQNDQLELRFRKYGVKYGISNCVVEAVVEEIGDYNETKRRLGLS